MAFKREWVEEWIVQHAPGERLVSHLVTGMWKGVVVKETFRQGSTAEMRSTPLVLKGEKAFKELVGSIAVDPSRQVAPLVDASFLALTDRRLLAGSRSSLRNRPKDLLHSAPADGVTVHWYDHDETAGNRFRHLLIEFGDGYWRLERTGLAALGKDLDGSSNVQHFFVSLGHRSHALGVG